MTSREQFEAAYERGNFLCMDGPYDNPRKNQAFVIWQASRQQLEVKLPAPDQSYDNHGQLLSRDSVIAALEAAGVRVAP